MNGPEFSPESVGRQAFGLAEPCTGRGNGSAHPLRERLLAALRWNPWVILAVHGALAASLYTLAAHFPIREPAVVAPWTIDAAIPLVPAAAWPYATYLLLLPATVLAARTLPAFERVLLCGLTCALLNVLVYIAWPTMLAARAPAPPGTLLAVIQHLDTTRCAIPSGHVSLPTALAVSAALAAGSVSASRKSWTLLMLAFGVWAVLLAASTLLTKQHYMVDALVGAVFGASVAGGVWAACAPVRSHGRG